MSGHPAQSTSRPSSPPARSPAQQQRNLCNKDTDPGATLSKLGTVSYPGSKDFQTNKKGFEFVQSNKI